MEWLMTFLGFGMGFVMGVCIGIIGICVFCSIYDQMKHEEDCPCSPCFKRRLKKAMEQEEFFQQKVEIEKTVQRMKEARKYL
jgi:hypothetical protein